MNCFLRNSAQRFSHVVNGMSSITTTPTATLHTSPVLQGAVWKKYQWTPWPWPLGLKNRRSRWNASRPGYQRLRRPYERPRPGSEEGQISGPYFRKFSQFFHLETLKLLRLFTRQCEVYAAQRIRRAQQICLFYGNIYNKKTAKNFLKEFFAGSAKTRIPGSFMAFMGATVFALEKPERWVVEISDSDIERCFEDLANWSVDAKNQNDGFSEWENVTKTKNCDVFVKTSTGSAGSGGSGGSGPTGSGPTGPPEYRALGTFLDIPAATFFETQLDLNYRKKWDKLVLKLEVVEKDAETGTEVLQWVSQFPFPFDPREYIYQRRFKIDTERNAMVVISRGCNHPKVPKTSSYVRVQNYYSALLIRPHRTFEEDGFDYVLAYIDDPQTFLPKMAVQYAAKSTLPDFMAKLHDASKALLKKFGRPESVPASVSVPASASRGEGKENVRITVAGGDVFDRTARMPTP